MIVGSALDVSTQSVTFDGYEYAVKNFFGHPASLVVPDPDGPQSQYSAAVTPGATIPPHYHTVNQFQVFMAGDGVVGRHEAEPVSLHYADAYTTYGPIVAEGPGLAFFTFRASRDSGARFMPGSRHELAAHPRGRQLVARVPSGDSLPVGDPVDLLGAHPDGLRAAAVRLGPVGEVAVPEQRHGGTYAVVVDGAIRHEGRAHPRLTNIFLRPGDPGVRLVAADAGALLLTLEFPGP